MNHRYFLNAYMSRDWEIRDSIALTHLGAAIGELGYTYADTIRNWDPEMLEEPLPPLDAYLETMTSTDIIVQATRPPLDDNKKDQKKTVPKSGNALERWILPSLRPWFKTLDRGQATLKPEVAARSTQIAAMASTQYWVYACSEFQAIIPTDGEQKKFKRGEAGQTAAFLLHVKHLWKGGPGFLTAFGMSSLDTHDWCYYLRRHPSLLLTTPFAMAVLPTMARTHLVQTSHFPGEENVIILRDADPETDDERPTSLGRVAIG